MRKIWTIAQIARAFGFSRQRAQQLTAQGRIKHDLEDQGGVPYFSKPPVIDPPAKKRRKP